MASSSSSNNEVKVDRVSEIMTSKSDERQYRVITLPNQLDVMLVSDPETEKAACAMAVRVGHFADPAELPGLAHFCEHMLFLGTKKYPDETAYNQYLKDHGGSSNASTAMHDTIYQFDVHSAHLEGALDRFSQFFISPLFTESATDRELNAVNSENMNNYQSDGHRLYQFDKSLARPEHPFHKFGTGNIDTLKNDVPANISVRDELLKFHENYYSSAVMKLCIVGKQNLDELEQLAIEKFKDVKLNEKRLTPPEYSKDAFDKTQFPVLHKIVPVREMRQLRICWPMSSSYDNWVEKPTSLFGFCLGDEGPGSVLAHLKELGWATELSAGGHYDVPEFGMQSCSISLTPEGLKHWKDVVSIVYAYLFKMSQLSDAQWNSYFEERKIVTQMNFDYKGKEAPYSYSRAIAGSLQHYPKDKVLLCMGGIKFGFDAKKVRSYLKEMHVDAAYYQLVCKDFEMECKQEEKWYNTKFAKEEIEKETLEKWRKYLKGEVKSNNDENLHTPPLNPYIADNFDIFCEKYEGKEENPKQPVVLIENTGHRLWFRMDDTFKHPKLCYEFRLHNPLFGETARASILSQIVMMYLNDALSKHTYVFNEASMDYFAGYGGPTSLMFSFAGFNQKLPLLVDTVLNKFANLEFDESRFKDIYEAAQRSALSRLKSKPYQFCDVLTDYLLINDAYTVEQLVEAVQNVTLDDVKQHYKKFLNNIFVEGLLFGNVDKAGAGEYEALINKYLIDTSGSSNQKFLRMEDIIDSKLGALKLSEGGSEHVLRYKVRNEEEKNNAVLNGYAYKSDSAADFAPLNMLLHLMSVPCFDTLRTKEQLGYIVWSGADRIRGMWFARIIVQSGVADPLKLDERIEAFLKEFGTNILPKIDEKTFETNKVAIINNLMEKPKSIGKLNNRYWNEIATLRYEFERREELAKEIAKLKLEDVINVYKEHIAHDAPKRCKLTVQSFGSVSEMKTDAENGKVVFGADEVNGLREKYGYHPFTYKKGKDGSKM